MLRKIEITFHDHVLTVCKQLHVLHGRFDANFSGRSLGRVNFIIKFDVDFGLLERMIESTDPIDFQGRSPTRREDFQIGQRLAALRVEQAVNYQIVGAVYRQRFPRSDPEFAPLGRARRRSESPRPGNADASLDPGNNCAPPPPQNARRRSTRERICGRPLRCSLSSKSAVRENSGVVNSALQSGASTGLPLASAS